MKVTQTKKTNVTQPSPTPQKAAVSPQRASPQQVLAALAHLPPHQQHKIALNIQTRAKNDLKTLNKLELDRKLRDERKGMKKVLVPNDKKTYGTTANGAKQTVAKFTLNSMQAALLAWAHTVLNPRTLFPHPVPLGAFAGGSSAAEARMYQVTLYGTAVVNSAGCFWIIVNSDGWVPVIPSDPIIPSQINSIYGMYLTYPGISSAPGASTPTPVTYTLESWVGEGSPGTTGADCPNNYMHNAPFSDDGTILQSPYVGLAGCALPINFCPAPYSDTQPDARYNEVSTELRLRPEGKLIDQSGDIGIFNWRGTPTRSMYPTSMANAPTYDDMLEIPNTFLSRNRLAVADWPSNKWMSAVANPNTVCCFNQPLIQPAAWSNVGAGRAAGINNTVGFPSIFACGKGLEPGTTIEFEVTKNYAIYGIPTFQTGSRSATDVAVGADQVASTVQNGMRDLVKPIISSGEKETARGVASVIKSEQMAGSMPTGPGALQSIVGGVKTAIPVIESITGTSIGETIAEVLGGLGALLL